MACVLGFIHEGQISDFGSYGINIFRYHIKHQQNAHVFCILFHASPCFAGKNIVTC